MTVAASSIATVFTTSRENHRVQIFSGLGAEVTRRRSRTVLRSEQWLCLRTRTGGGAELSSEASSRRLSHLGGFGAGA